MAELREGRLDMRLEHQMQGRSRSGPWGSRNNPDSHCRLSEVVGNARNSKDHDLCGRIATHSPNGHGKSEVLPFLGFDRVGEVSTISAVGVFEEAVSDSVVMPDVQPGIRVVEPGFLVNAECVDSNGLRRSRTSQKHQTE